MTREEVKKALAEKIKARLEQLGMQKQQFADLVGVSNSTVTKWLKGEHNFTTRTLFKIERVLQLSLFFLDDDPVELDPFLGWV